MGHTVIMNWEAKVRGRNGHLWTSASTTAVALMKSPARCFLFAEFTVARSSSGSGRFLAGVLGTAVGPFALECCVQQ